MLENQKENKFILFVGPSGSGKTTIIRHLTSQYPHLFIEAVSTTSRQPRKGEISGKDYYYVSEDTFAMESAFIEKTFYAGNYYGLTYSELYKKIENHHVLAAVDIHGARQIQKMFGRENVITFFVYAPIETLEERMKGRGDSSDKISQRLNNIEKHKEYDNMKYCNELIMNTVELNNKRINYIKNMILNSF